LPAKGSHDQQSALKKIFFKLISNGLAQSSRRADYDRLSTFKKVLQYIFFDPAVKTADDAMIGIPLSDRPIVTFENRTRRYIATAKKCCLFQA
jgi:hypothetical protein